MNFETPIITTNVEGIPEIIEAGETGFLVEPEEEKELSQKINFIIENPEKARDVAKNGKNKLREKYDINKIVADYESIYERVK